MMDETTRARLVAAALEARERAYAPYSHYPVGAALLTASGRVFTGVNVENAAYPSGMCAERVAVFKAVSEGERSFEAIAIAAAHGAPPCGACRQVLAEFSTTMAVLVVDEQGRVLQETTLGELLPAPFDPSFLPPRGT